MEPTPFVFFTIILTNNPLVNQKMKNFLTAGIYAGQEDAKRGCLTKERFRQIAQRKRKLSLRTSDRCHWCGNPPDFSSRYQEVSLLTGGFPRQCAHWLGMTVLLFVQFFFSETAPLLCFWCFQREYVAFQSESLRDSHSSIQVCSVRVNYFLIPEERVLAIPII